MGFRESAPTTSSVQTLKRCRVFFPNEVIIATSAAFATPRQKNTAYARNVMPRIEGVPLTAEVNFEPAAEIHRARQDRDADIPKVARGIVRRNT